jgi:tryptophan halogenase
VTAREHGNLTADLYVDCTGFRGLLINGALEEPFLSFQDSLPNDRAVALRVPVDAGAAGIPPYTTATAVEAGWIWTIPLFDRIGTGYVYAADYCTPDRAEQLLREFVGPGAADVPAQHIRMRIGRNRNSWVDNCVAIGLSSGFVEPLESTGIFLIHHGVEQLVRHWPDQHWDDRLRRSYNRQVARCLDGVRDFLVFHFYGAGRADNEYWRDAKRRHLPDGVADRVEQWRTQLPDCENTYPYYHGFEPYSHTCMLLGLGGIGTTPRPALQLMDATAAQKALDSIRTRARDLVQTLPSHLEYLVENHSSARGASDG